MNTEAMELTRQFADVTRSRTLREIVDAVLEAMHLAITDDGEVKQGWESALDALHLTLQQKVEAYHVVYNELHEKHAGSKSLEAYYGKRARVQEARAERLKARLFEEMTRLGSNKIETQTVTACREKSPDSVEHVAGTPIPPEYALPAETKLDKKKACIALANGAQLPFAKLITDKKHLRFR